MLEERIQKRIAELEQAEKETVLQLTVIRSMLAEYRALLAPVLTGAPLGEIDDARGEA